MHIYSSILNLELYGYSWLTSINYFTLLGSGAYYNGGRYIDNFYFSYESSSSRIMFDYEMKSRKMFFFFLMS